MEWRILQPAVMVLHIVGRSCSPLPCCLHLVKGWWKVAAGCSVMPACGSMLGVAYMRPNKNTPKARSLTSHLFFDLIPKKAVLQKHRNEDGLHQCAWSWIFGSRSLKHRPKYANIPKWKQDQRCALLVVSPIECGLEFWVVLVWDAVWPRHRQVRE